MADNRPGSSGLAPNIAAGLAYLFGVIGGIVFIVIEKQDRFVRFHAMQSIILNVAMIVVLIAVAILGAILSVISDVLGGIVGALSCVVWVGFIVIWVYCLIKAFQGAMFKLPVIGDMAEKYI